MFDIGFGEMLFLGAVALIAIGPKQLPEVARVVGKTLNEFKRATGDFTKAFTDTRDSFDRQVNNFQDSIQSTLDKATPVLESPKNPELAADYTPPPEEDPNQMHFPDTGDIEPVQNNTIHHPDMALDEHRQLSFDFSDTHKQET